MYRANGTGGNPFAAVLLAMALGLSGGGCGGGDADSRSAFEPSSLADRSYDQNREIDGETLPEANGGGGALTYSISPPLPAGLTFDATTRVLSGTPTTPQAAILYTYTATDGDAEKPYSASLTFRITVEAVAAVTLSVASTEVDEGEDRRPLIVTVNLSQPVRGALTVALASTGTAVLSSDFDLASSQLTVAQGSTRALTTVTPIRDLEAETETIRLEIEALGGRGEIGSPSSVRIAVRDRGAPQAKLDYAALEAFLLIHRLEEDAVSFVVYVTNIGDVAASSTRAVLYTTTDDLLSSSPDLAGLEVLRVPALEQGGWWLSAPIWVSFKDLVRGKNNYFYFCARAASGEDPALVGCGAVDYTAVFLTDGNRIPTTCTGFSRDTEPGTQDPLFGQQWSLNNTGQASFAANGGVAGQDLNMRQTLVDGPTGAGVQVAVVDTGLEICHPDLAANIEQDLSYNFSHSLWHGAQADDPFLPTVMGDHGTSVAGLIAAAANNGVGGRGVAPEVRLRGFNFLLSPDQPMSEYLNSLGMNSADLRSNDVHVFNMSFGSIGSAENLPADQRELFKFGVTDLREGRGALYVKAAGNEFNDCTEIDENRQPVSPLLDLSVELGCTAANRDGENNLPYVIVAGGFSADGKRSSYSSAGATLWVVAPAGEYGRRQPAMITTDQMGTDRGYGLYGGPLGSDRAANPLGDYTSIFNGTSSAAPNTSGAIALLLQTQPELTWRDVKHILAKTARRLDAGIPRVRVAFGGTPAVLQHGWITNAAGYHFHNWYGFGAIDVDAAVALAATHTPSSLGVFTQSAPVRLAVAVTIPDHDGGGLTQTQNVTGLSRTANIEAVQLRIEVTHANPRELGVELISPAGTRSIINPVFNGALKGAPNPLDWTILSNAFYGESPSGEWTLNVIDVAEDNIGTLDAWSLIFYLREHPEDR